MRCRYCHGTESKVVDSRPTDDGTSIRRRRECMSCGRRFTTYEKIEKILMGVRKACEKRPVSAAQMDKLVEEVVREVNNTLEQEVTSTYVGELVMRGLKELDEVAYVRFASVYRQFKDINTFMEELKLLLNDKCE